MMTSLVTLQEYMYCVLSFIAPFCQSANYSKVKWQTDFKGSVHLNHKNTYFPFLLLLQRYADCFARFLDIDHRDFWHPPSNGGEWNFVCGTQSFGNIGKAFQKRYCGYSGWATDLTLNTFRYILLSKENGQIHFYLYWPKSHIWLKWLYNL